MIYGHCWCQISEIELDMCHCASARKTSAGPETDKRGAFGVFAQTELRVKGPDPHGRLDCPYYYYLVWMLPA